jgi:hypothetical protein
MSKLRERVRGISTAARQDGRSPREGGFYKNIVQVEFNVWQHTDGDLWTSLLAHVFCNLSVDESDGDDLLRERCEALLAELTVDAAALAAAERHS